MENFRIIVENVSKKFTRDYSRHETSLSRTLSFIFGSTHKVEFDALKNISFKLASGKNLGIIGKNGGGKSTLLRIIAGIYKPDSGEVSVNGNMVYLAGFGQGLKPKLTMRENIYLVGSIMGLSQKEIDSRFEEIVEFSGLREYIDTKVYQFSAGMMTRLNFSITTFCIVHKNPDILLIDEAIGGGADITFQKKALDKMEELIKGGASVILVSHSLDQIEKYCNEAIWLENGGIVMQGDSKKIVDAYVKTYSDDGSVKGYVERKKKREMMKIGVENAKMEKIIAEKISGN